MNEDVKALAQQIADETAKLVAAIETLDANQWLTHADKLDSLNSQLQGLITESQSSSDKDSEKVN